MTPHLSDDRQQSPSSPPPSFRSRTSSPSSRRLLTSDNPIATDAERTLHDTFDDGSDSDGEGRAEDDRQRLMRSNTIASTAGSRSVLDENRRLVLSTPTPQPGPDAPRAVNVPARPPASNHPFSSFQHNDGVFANLSAKPERGEKTEEQPPVCLSSPSLYGTIADHHPVLRSRCSRCHPTLLGNYNPSTRTSQLLRRSLC